MTRQHPGSAVALRKLKLGDVKVVKRNITKAKVVVDSDGSTGLISLQGVALVGDVSVNRGLTSKPSHFEVADAEQDSLDVILVPTMVEDEDHIAIDWIEKGRSARMGLSRLMTLKQIRIPAGTRMDIDLSPTTDPDFGPAILLHLKDAPFVAKKKGAPRKKKGQAPAAGNSSAETKTVTAIPVKSTVVGA